MHEGPSSGKMSLYEKTGVSREDVGHIIVRKGRGPRWTPPWAMDDRKVRLVVYNYLWSYVNWGRIRECSPSSPSVVELEKMAAEFRSRVKKNRVFIKHVETVGRHGTAAVYTSLIYMAYRQRMRSNEMAEQFEGMSKVQVRQILHRLNEVARRLFPASEHYQRHWTALRPKKNSRTQRILDLHDAGWLVPAIAKELGMSTWAVRKALYARGLKSNAGHPQRANLYFNEIVFWMRQGVSRHDLQRTFKCGISTIKRAQRCLT